MHNKMDGNDNIMNTACAHPSAHPISVMGSIMGELYHCYRPHYKTEVANMVGHCSVQTALQSFTLQNQFGFCKLFTQFHWREDFF